MGLLSTLLVSKTSVLQMNEIGRWNRKVVWCWKSLMEETRMRPCWGLGFSLAMANQSFSLLPSEIRGSIRWWFAVWRLARSHVEPLSVQLLFKRKIITGDKGIRQRKISGSLAFGPAALSSAWVVEHWEFLLSSAWVVEHWEFLPI